MNRPLPSRRTTAAALPRGFTLLELMMVVALITLLLTVLVLAAGNSITQARQQATKTTLTKIDGMLQQRIEAFRVLLDSPQWKSIMKTKATAKLRDLQQQPIPASPPFGSISVDTKMAELLAYKDLFRQNFPQALSDNPALSAPGQPFAGNTQSAADSSELLYWMLTKSEAFGVPPVDDSEFTSAEVADTDSDGLREFVDNWGQPLRFYRWPTRLIRPAGSGTTIQRVLASVLLSGLPAAPTQSGDVDPLALDPDDHLGVYLSTVSASRITPEHYEALAHTPDTYTIPLVVSSGVDRTLGLLEPNDTTVFNPTNARTWYARLAMPTSTALADPLNSELNDNLTNRQKQK